MSKEGVEKMDRFLSFKQWVYDQHNLAISDMIKQRLENTDYPKNVDEKIAHLESVLMVLEIYEESRYRS